MPETPRGFERIERGRHVLVADPEFLPAAEALIEPGFLERAFDTPVAAGRSEVARVELGEGLPPLLLRRLVHGGATGPLFGRGFLGMGRPLGELDVTRRLHKAGAPVPRPALAVGRRAFGPVFHCAVATCFEEGAVDLLAFLRRPPEPDVLARVAEASGRAVRRLHDAGGRHADLHVKNILVHEAAPLRCLVVDLDKARITVDLTPDERMTQLMRLYRSLVKRGVLETVGPRGCARFFSAYCADDRRLRRALWRRVRAELRRVAVHQIGYRDAHRAE